MFQPSSYLFQHPGADVGRDLLLPRGRRPVLQQAGPRPGLGLVPGGEELHPAAGKADILSGCPFGRSSLDDGGSQQPDDGQQIRMAFP